MSLFKRKAEGNLRDKKRRPYEDGDRDWSDVATAKEYLGPVREDSPLEPW